jgi:biotin synthase
LKRLCLQATRHPNAEDALVLRIRELVLHQLPVCLSAGVDNLTQVEKWLAAGADKVSIALDGATPAIFQEVKGGDFYRTLALLEKGAGNFPGRMATHLVAGLGETEEEMCRLIARLTGQKITVALFAFTPVAGTPLGNEKPPEIGNWRRLQITNALLTRDPALLKCFRFSPQGRILSFGLGLDYLTQVGKEAFRTSGCPDCNRPYYNERPGTELYNYPRPLTEAELAQTISRLEVEE